eukprot:CAMPEP_0117649158 /NCGR_PEP_ID=MMETSP0804-20121206/816_1 /TAXON_ID=1074897 /ORGANISM="Tetraselmis astigmatica, Strain CCMP880" /LENGTH=1231 /DNA_ID=CAMNT_0005454863 /DNA_START=1453 /DNA_END=5148 /DNA_ORIENTATION=+
MLAELVAIPSAPLPFGKLLDGGPTCREAAVAAASNKEASPPAPLTPSMPAGSTPERLGPATEEAVQAVVMEELPPQAATAEDANGCGETSLPANLAFARTTAPNGRLEGLERGVAPEVTPVTCPVAAKDSTEGPTQEVCCANVQQPTTPLCGAPNPSNAPPSVATASVAAAANGPGVGDLTISSPRVSETSESEASPPGQQPVAGLKKGRKHSPRGLPRVRRSQRCGSCHTCRNPQMKKACLTLRAQKEQQNEEGATSSPQMSSPVTAEGSKAEGVELKSPTIPSACGAPLVTVSISAGGPPASRLKVTLLCTEAQQLPVKPGNEVSMDESSCKPPVIPETALPADFDAAPMEATAEQQPPEDAQTGPAAPSAVAAPLAPAVAPVEAQEPLAPAAAAGSPAPADVQKAAAPIPAQAPAAPQPHERTLTEVLRPLLSHNGGVEDPSKLQPFQELLQLETTLKGRVLLLTIMDMTTTKESLQYMVKNDVLVVLNQWLSEARASGNASGSEASSAEVGAVVKRSWQLARKIIAAMEKLPVTKDALLKSQAGKTVRSLTKAVGAGEGVAAAAKNLVAHWKKKFVREEQQAAAAKAEWEASAKGSAGGKASAEASGSAAAGKRPAGLLIVAADDDSLFASSSRKEAPPRAKPYQLPRRKVQRLAEPPTSPTATSAPAADSAPADQLLPSSEAEAATPADGEPSEAEASPSPSPLPSGEAPGSSTAEEVTASKDSEAASSAAKEGDGVTATEVPEAALVTTFGGNTAADGKPKTVPIKIATTSSAARLSLSAVLRTAAQRAAEAAARVPDFEPKPRSSPKKKVVRWAEDENLAAVRLFHKEMPPAAIREDATTSGADLVHDPGFESATKREHTNEREAMAMARTLNCREDDPCVASDQQQLRPRVAWSPPPLVLLLDQESPVALGEDSEEATTQRARERHTAPAAYPNGVVEGSSPLEPPPLALHDMLSAARHAPLQLPWLMDNIMAAVEEQVEQQQPSPSPTVRHSDSAISSMINGMDPSLVMHLLSSKPQAPPEAATAPAPVPTGRASGWDIGGLPPANRPASAPMRNRYEEPLHSRGLWAADERIRGSGRAPCRHSPSQGFSAPPGGGWAGPPGREPRDRRESGWDSLGPETPRWSGGSVGGRQGGGAGPRPGRGPPSGPAQRGPPPPPHNPGAKPCLFFNTPQGCRNGLDCRFAHVSYDVPPAQISRALSAISKKRPPHMMDSLPPHARRRFD